MWKGEKVTLAQQLGLVVTTRHSFAEPQQRSLFLAGIPSPLLGSPLAV